MLKKIIKFPKQYKTIMSLMPADRRADFKRAMISAIIRSEEKAPVRTKKADVTEAE